MARPHSNILNEKPDKEHTNFQILECDVVPEAYYITYQGKAVSLKKEYKLGLGTKAYLPKVMSERRCKSICKFLNKHFNTTDFSYERCK